MQTWENFDEIPTKVEVYETLAETKRKWTQRGKPETIRVYGQGFEETQESK